MFKTHSSDSLSFIEGQQDFDNTFNFMDTAGVISNCDYVVTSDSAIAHLSSAMGKQTYVALSYVPEWRWGLTEERSIWYSKCYLHRQRYKGEWVSVITEIKQALIKNND